MGSGESWPDPGFSMASSISSRTADISARMRAANSWETLVSGSCSSAQLIAASMTGSRSFPLSVNSYRTWRPLVGSLCRVMISCASNRLNRSERILVEMPSPALRKSRKTGMAFKHHVPNDQQGPSVAEHTHNEPNRAFFWLVNHVGSIPNHSPCLQNTIVFRIATCNLQVIRGPSQGRQEHEPLYDTGRLGPAPWGIGARGQHFSVHKHRRRGNLAPLPSPPSGR